MEKYITKEEYRDAKGVDLDAELHSADDESNKSKRFIRNVTDACVDYLIAEFRAFELEDWPAQGDPTNPILTEERQRLFREGVMEQMEYVLSNGNLNQHAGLNIELGTITDMSKIDLSRTARRKFQHAGFCNI